MTVGSRQIAFLPWLRLKARCRVGGVDFMPWREKGTVAPSLADCSESLSAILSGYLDRKGKPIDNCVLATIPGRGWNLADSDFESVRWAASLLFLSTWASNEYYPHFGGPYVNSSAFRVVWQRFTGKPTWISLTARRRDGRALDGGYKHGEVTFSLPIHCSLREAAVVDDAIRAALDTAHRANSDTAKRLRYALPFVELANTDDDLMTETAEAVLMGSAFEQLLQGDASAYKLGKKFGALFAAYGKVTVADAKKVRPGIQVDQTKPEYAAAQPKWWVHRKWMEELYDVRSKAVHQGTPGGKTWGWSPEEHLVMAAWVFPLAVKLILEQDQHYALTDKDKGHCLSVDKLLASTGWAEDPKGESKWHEIVSKTARRFTLKEIAERAWERLKHLRGESP